MKNHLIYKLQSKVLIDVKGKNIERFIKRLITNKIELLKVKHIKYDETHILVYKKDVDKILELKTIYDVTEQNIYGIIKIQKIINSYKYIIMFFFLGIAILLFLGNVIFDVEVVHNNSEIRKLILTELSDYKISKYNFKKNFKDIQNIKNSILEKYKDKIEWLEIENVGTKYIIRLEERIIPNLNKDETKQNVIAKKSAIIKKIVAQNGEVIREINEYVNKGDVVITGNVYLYENIKDTVRAQGTVYGEVWYNITVEYPFIYSEIKETGNTKNVYTLNVLNKKIEFVKNPFKEKRFEGSHILFHPFLPLYFDRESQKEVVTISEVLTKEQAIEKAINRAKDKMNESLKEDEYIVNSQVLKTDIKEDKVELTVFFSVIENITDYQVIEEVKDVP